MVYEDGIEENLLQLSAHSENSEWFYTISVIIFLGQHSYCIK